MTLSQPEKKVALPEDSRELLEINSRLVIPLAEVRFSYARSSGPGGQHVNKVNTKATLHFDVAASPSLTAVDRQKILTRLAARISKNGILQIASFTFRSQTANRKAALERFVELLAGALVERKKRRATRPTLASREKRIARKKHRAITKKARRRGGLDRE